MEGQDEQLHPLPLGESPSEPQQSLHAFYRGGSQGTAEKDGGAAETMTGPSVPREDFGPNICVLEDTSGGGLNNAFGPDDLMESLQSLAVEGPVVPGTFNSSGNSNPNPPTVTDESFVGSSTHTTGNTSPNGGMLTMDARLPLPSPVGRYPPSTAQDQQQQLWPATSGSTNPSSFSSLPVTTNSNLGGAAPSSPDTTDANNIRLQLCQAVFRQNLLLQQMLISRNAFVMHHPWGAFPSVMANPGFLANMGLQQQQQLLSFQLLSAAGAVPETVAPILANTSVSAFGGGQPPHHQGGFGVLPASAPGSSSALPTMGGGAAAVASTAASVAMRDSSSRLSGGEVAAFPPEGNQGSTQRSHLITTGYGGLKKPKRPLSAYNLYFKDERVNLLNEVQQKADESGAKPASGRVKVSFEDMARTIGSRWKRLEPERIAEYKQRAAVDKDRYDKQMKLFNEQKLQLLTTGRQKQEDTVSEDTHE